MDPRIRKIVYRAFYQLPGRWRRSIVRLIQPGFTIGALTIVRDAEAPPPGRILLLRQPPNSGWSIPGGLMDRGEKPIQCARRELAEETGIKVELDQLREAQPNAIIHTKGQWVDCVFEVDVPPTDTFEIDAAEVFEAAWHPIDALPPLTGPTAQLLSYYGIGPYVDYPEVRK